MKTPRVLVPLAEGFEDIEGIVIIDILRRAEIEVVTAGLKDGVVEASRKTKHIPDTVLSKVSQEEFDAVVLPGGLPGTDYLKEDSRVRDIVTRHAQKGCWVAAICAAPTILADLGLLKGKRCTSYPGFGAQMKEVQYLEDRVVVDGKIITSRGPGTTIEFALKLVEVLCGTAKATEIGKGVLVK